MRDKLVIIMAIVVIAISFFSSGLELTGLYGYTNRITPEEIISGSPTSRVKQYITRTTIPEEWRDKFDVDMDGEITKDDYYSAIRCLSFGGSSYIRYNRLSNEKLVKRAGVADRDCKAIDLNDNDKVELKEMKIFKTMLDRDQPSATFQRAQAQRKGKLGCSRVGELRCLSQDPPKLAKCIRDRYDGELKLQEIPVPDSNMECINGVYRYRLTV